MHSHHSVFFMFWNKLAIQFTQQKETGNSENVNEKLESEQLQTYCTLFEICSYGCCNLSTSNHRLAIEMLWWVEQQQNLKNLTILSNFNQEICNQLFTLKKWYQVLREWKLV